MFFVFLFFECLYWLVDFYIFIIFQSGAVSSVILLMFKLSQLWPMGTPSSWRLSLFDMILSDSESKEYVSLKAVKFFYFGEQGQIFISHSTKKASVLQKSAIEQSNTLLPKS